MRLAGPLGATFFLPHAVMPFVKHLGQHHEKASCTCEVALLRCSPRHSGVSWKTEAQKLQARNSPVPDRTKTRARG